MDKEAKKAFFDELYQLDKEESSQEDQSNLSLILGQSRLPRSIPTTRLPHSLRPEQPLLRTVSAPLPQPSASSPRQPNAVEKSLYSPMVSSKPSDQIVIDTPIKTKNNPSMTAHKETSKTSGKRKRGQSLELKPESQQIFKGLAFCESRAYASYTFVDTHRVQISYQTTTRRFLVSFEFGRQWSGERSGSGSGEMMSLMSSSTRICLMTMFLKPSK